MDKEDRHMDACIAWTPTNRQQLPLPILDLHPELRAFPSTPTPCFTVSFSFFSPFGAKIIILSLYILWDQSLINYLLGVGQCFAWHVTHPVVDVSISTSGMVF
jgi:hypothetical protein